MKKVLLPLLIFSALLMGCVSEEQQQNVTTPTKPEELPINESEIDETLSDLQKIENIDFNL